MLGLLLALLLQESPEALLGLGAADAERLARANELLSAEQLRRHVEFLASDALGGRGTGSEGNDRAADYLAQEFRKAGLAPAGDADADGKRGWFQAFEVGAAKARNVLGLWEGSDPALKEQVVVVGGHYDHLGTLPKTPGEDKIHNGADDNASGTATVAALAVAFGGSGLRPRRSILFIGFGGEEAGLVGSRHYVRHPRVPAERHAAMVNLDMVGRNPEHPVDIFGTGQARRQALHKIAQAAVGRTGLKARLNRGSMLDFAGSSDHESFQRAGIPSMFFFTGLHPDYHKPGDHADKIAYERMETLGETALLVVAGIANRAEPLLFAGPRQLGVALQRLDAAEAAKAGLPAGQGAIGVAKVTEGSAAERAGIKAGDWILKLGDKSLPAGDRAERALRLAIDRVEPETDVSVVLWREGARVEVTARWED